MKYTEFRKMVIEEREEIQMMNIKAIDDWIQLGGFICYDYIDENWTQVGLFRCDDDVYFDWIGEHQLVDTEENQKSFCRISLEYANVPDEVIEELLDW